MGRGVGEGEAPAGEVEGVGAWGEGPVGGWGEVEGVGVWGEAGEGVGVWGEAECAGASGEAGVGACAWGEAVPACTHSEGSALRALCWHICC